MLLGDEAALYADAAYSSKETRNKLEQLGIDDQAQRKGYRGSPLSEADRVRNQRGLQSPDRAVNVLLSPTNGIMGWLVLGLRPLHESQFTLMRR